MCSAIPPHSSYFGREVYNQISTDNAPIVFTKQDGTPEKTITFDPPRDFSADDIDNNPRITFNYKKESETQGKTIAFDIGKETELFKKIQGLKTGSHNDAQQKIAIKALIVKHIAVLLKVKESSTQPLQSVTVSFEPESEAVTLTGNKGQAIADSKFKTKKSGEDVSVSQYLRGLTGTEKTSKIFAKALNPEQAKPRAERFTPKHVPPSPLHSSPLSTTALQRSSLTGSHEEVTGSPTRPVNANAQENVTVSPQGTGVSPLPTTVAAGSVNEPPHPSNAVLKSFSDKSTALFERLLPTLPSGDATTPEMAQAHIAKLVAYKEGFAAFQTELNAVDKSSFTLANEAALETINELNSGQIQFADEKIAELQSKFSLRGATAPVNANTGVTGGVVSQLTAHSGTDGVAEASSDKNAKMAELVAHEETLDTIQRDIASFPESKTPNEKYEFLTLKWSALSALRDQLKGMDFGDLSSTDKGEVQQKHRALSGKSLRLYTDLTTSLTQLSDAIVSSSSSTAPSSPLKEEKLTKLDELEREFSEMSTAVFEFVTVPTAEKKVAYLTARQEDIATLKAQIETEVSVDDPGLSKEDRKTVTTKQENLLRQLNQLHETAHEFSEMCKQMPPPQSAVAPPRRSPVVGNTPFPEEMQARLKELDPTEGDNFEVLNNKLRNKLELLRPLELATIPQEVRVNIKGHFETALEAEDAEIRERLKGLTDQARRDYAGNPESVINGIVDSIIFEEKRTLIKNSPLRQTEKDTYDFRSSSSQISPHPITPESTFGLDLSPEAIKARKATAVETPIVRKFHSFPGLEMDHLGSTCEMLRLIRSGISSEGTYTVQKESKNLSNYEGNNVQTIIRGKGLDFSSFREVRGGGNCGLSATCAILAKEMEKADFPAKEFTSVLRSTIDFVAANDLADHPFLMDKFTRGIQILQEIRNEPGDKLSKLSDLVKDHKEHQALVFAMRMINTTALLENDSYFADINGPPTHEQREAGVHEASKEDITRSLINHGEETEWEAHVGFFNRLGLDLEVVINARGKDYERQVPANRKGKAIDGAALFLNGQHFSPIFT